VSSAVVEGTGAHRPGWLGESPAKGARVPPIPLIRLVQQAFEVQNEFFLADEVLPDLCRMSVQTLDVAGAGVMLMSAGTHVLRWASDEGSRRIEELQDSLDEGPCLHVYRHGESVLVPDLRADGRWPRFALEASSHGIGAVFAFPVAIGGVRFGALDVYQQQPGRLSAAQLGLAELIAYLTARLALRLRLGDDDNLGPLTADAQRRSLIEQAKGVVAGRLATSIEEATNRLREQAASSGRPLAEVATEVLEGGVGGERES
jgi:GAF domain-containing protein